MHQLFAYLLKAVVAESRRFDGCYDHVLDTGNVLKTLYAASQHCLNQELDNTFLRHSEHDAIAEMNPHHLKRKEISRLLDMVTAKQPLQGTQMSDPSAINTFTINLQCGS